MPHVILDMNNCANALRGDASTGNVKDLQDAFNALDTALAGHGYPHETEAHELLVNIQAFLCDGGTYALGAADQSADYTIQCKDLTP